MENGCLRDETGEVVRSIRTAFQTACKRAQVSRRDAPYLATAGDVRCGLAGCTSARRLADDWNG
jgi:hypothetical protein